MPLATERFRRQHAELAELAGALSKQLATQRLDPGAAQHALAQIAGKLKVHAAMENEALYPRLLSHDDAHVRATAGRFATEFGDVYELFLEFRGRWPDAAAIARAPADFSAQAHGAFVLLGERIKAENAELYEMVDRLEHTPGV